MRTILILLLFLSGPSGAQQFSDLRGSKKKVDTAYKVAISHEYTFLQDSKQINKFVRLGLLVKIDGNNNYALNKVSHPFIRPAGKLFIERFSSQFKKANNEKLVVTSATRPLNKKLWNSSSKSVHPAGIAIDFRIPKKLKARIWLERNLLIIQSRGDIIATHEHNPPHYHVVIVPKKYEAYLKIKQNKK